MFLDLTGEVEILSAELDDSEQEDELGDADVGDSSTSGSRKRKKKAEKELPKWKKGHKFAKEIPSKDIGQTIGEAHPELILLSPLQLFYRIMPEEYFTDIAKLSMKYAKNKNEMNFKVTGLDIQQFVGLVLYSGYVRLPAEDDYWAKADDLKISICGTVMPKNRFRMIKKFNTLWL